MLILEGLIACSRIRFVLNLKLHDFIPSSKGSEIKTQYRQFKDIYLNRHVWPGPVTRPFLNMIFPNDLSRIALSYEISKQNVTVYEDYFSPIQTISCLKMAL